MGGGHNGLRLLSMGTGEVVILCLPLIMAIINIPFLIIGRARGWSFYTGIATFAWTALCIFGNNDAPDITILSFGFVIGTCCALSITISSLFTMLINPRQHLSFLLGHLSIAIFGVIAFLFLVLLKAIGIEMDAPMTILTSFKTNVFPPIFVIICLVTALILTLICDYYLFRHINGQKREYISKGEQPSRNEETDNECTETILDQHWIYCTKCGTKCKDYLKFCPRCGFALHPEREEPSSEYSSYAPSVKMPEQPEYILDKEKPKSADNAIPVIDNQQRPLVTKAGGVIHVENTVHPTMENISRPPVVEEKKPASIPESPSTPVSSSIPISSSPASGNKWGMWALIAIGVVLVGLIPAYLFWYKPYATDRDTPPDIIRSLI